MNWWAVLLAVVSGVAAALVNDPRPKARTAKKAPREPAASAPKSGPEPAQDPPAAPRPAEAPLHVDVEREGVASALPLIVAGPPVNLAPPGSERRPGESRRKRRARPDVPASSQAAGPAAHACPHCGHALAPELAPLAVQPTNLEPPAAAAPAAAAPAAAAPEAAAPEAAASELEADDDYSSQLDLSAYLDPASAAPESPREPAPAPTPEPAPAPERRPRVGAQGERLTLRLATRRKLINLVE